MSTITTTTYETRTYGFPDGFLSLSSKLFPFRWIFVVIGIILCIIGFCLFVASPALLVARAGYIDPGLAIMGFFGVFLFFIGGLLILLGICTHRYYYTPGRSPLVAVNGPVVETVTNEHLEQQQRPPKKPPVGGFSYTAQRNYTEQR